MNFDLDWELGVFNALRYGYRKVFGKEEGPSPEAVHLDAEKGRLLVFARALTGLPIEFREAETVGGRQGNFFLLPTSIDLFDERVENFRVYLLRIVQMASVELVPVPGDPAERLLVEAVTGYRSLLRSVEEFPSLAGLARRVAAVHLDAGKEQAGAVGLHPVHRFLVTRLAERIRGDAELGTGMPLAQAVAYVSRQVRRESIPKKHTTELLLWGRLYERPLDTGEKKKAGDGEIGTTPTGTEIKAPARENVNVIQVDEEAWKKKAFAPQIEKVEALEEFNGSMKAMDGSDEIEAHEEAMRDLNLREVIRTRERTESIFKADLMLENMAADAADAEEDGVGIPYDEWDGRKRAYRKEWCRVYPREARADQPQWAEEALQRHRRTLRRMEERWRRLENEYRARPRQTDGPEIDLDAVVDAYTTMRAGHTPSERLYVRPVREAPDTAIEILMDLSLSTDSYVNDYRVLDVARESVALFCESLGDLADDIGIAGFSSNTRHACRYTVIKRAGEPWRKARTRLGALEPEGYTRIGPALRHGTALLDKRRARRKCLLLLTDGKASDYDRYEGRYGIADVKQAVREAGQKGIIVHALAIESSGKDYLPAMLGHRNYQILPRPDMLVDALSDLFLRLQH